MDMRSSRLLQQARKLKTRTSLAVRAHARIDESSFDAKTDTATDFLEQQGAISRD
jgi:hypothetical protein